MNLTAIGKAKMLAAIAAMMGTGARRGRADGHHGTSIYHLKRPGRKRLQIARGAGTISAKADIHQLINARRWREAAAMARDHERQCGERLFMIMTLEAWEARG